MVGEDVIVVLDHLGTESESIRLGVAPLKESALVLLNYTCSDSSHLAGDVIIQLVVQN